jgi:hypothetical protein
MGNSSEPRLSKAQRDDLRTKSSHLDEGLLNEGLLDEGLLDPVHDEPGPRLTRAQRDTLLGWIAAGISDYTAIRQLLIKHGFPVIQRQNLDYYRKRYGKRPRCSACGREFPPVEPSE